MANVIKWNASESAENILTTELNSLADGANKLSAAFSNDAAGELDVFADFEFLIAAQGGARASDARVELYLLGSLDGTNFSMGSDTVDPSLSDWVGEFAFNAATTSFYSIIRGVRLPPHDFKLLVINETGQALASSGNTLKMRRYNIQQLSE